MIQLFTPVVNGDLGLDMAQKSIQNNDMEDIPKG